MNVFYLDNGRTKKLDNSKTRKINPTTKYGAMNTSFTPCPTTVEQASYNRHNVKIRYSALMLATIRQLLRDLEGDKRDE